MRCSEVSQRFAKVAGEVRDLRERTNKLETENTRELTFRQRSDSCLEKLHAHCLKATNERVSFPRRSEPFRGRLSLFHEVLALVVVCGLLIYCCLARQDAVLYYATGFFKQLADLLFNNHVFTRPCRPLKLPAPGSAAVSKRAKRKAPAFDLKLYFEDNKADLVDCFRQLARKRRRCPSRKDHLAAACRQLRQEDIYNLAMNTYFDASGSFLKKDRRS